MLISVYKTEFWDLYVDYIIKYIEFQILSDYKGLLHEDIYISFPINIVSVFNSI